MLLAFNALVFTPWEGGIHSILTRNPCFVWHWIPDQVRDDSHGVLEDNFSNQSGISKSRSGAQPPGGQQRQRAQGR